MAQSRHLKAADYQNLAAFRLAIRRFLAIADANAREAGLTAQQHQALLSIKGGYPDQEEISIGDLADHLLLKNHSAVELVARLVKAGLVVREPSKEDRRRVCIRITSRGEEVLDRLSGANLRELRASVEIMQALIASPDS
jgi:DNA-binding MarR family transcriptional regulator